MRCSSNLRRKEIVTLVKLLRIIRAEAARRPTYTHLHREEKKKKQNKHSCIRKQMIKMMFLKLRNF